MLRLWGMYVPRSVTMRPPTYNDFYEVHYHVIPAPRFNEKPPGVKKDPPTRAMMHRMEFESRGDLDEDFAQELSGKIRAYLSPAMLSHL
jgi:hypothetical protein